MEIATSLPPKLVENQLARIVGSRQFCYAPRLSGFVSYVVHEGLAARIAPLKGYAIGLDVFGEPEGFDPQTDAIVRVQARVLRQ